MAGNFSNYGREDIASLIANNKTLYVGLATEVITNTDDLSTITEEDDVNYSRQAVTLGNITNDGNDNIVLQNTTVVEFPQYSADADNPVKYVFLTESQTGTTGEVYAFGELTEYKSAVAGDKLAYDVGDLNFYLNA